MAKTTEHIFTTHDPTWFWAMFFAVSFFLLALVIRPMIGWGLYLAIGLILVAGGFFGWLESEETYKVIGRKYRLIRKVSTIPNWEWQEVKDKLK